MLHEASSAIVEEIHSRLPVYGSIINRKFDQVVINLGHRDGISSGTELMIIKKGMIQKNKSDFSLSYASEDLLGSIKISSSDELVSEGDVSVSQFFDMINPEIMLFRLFPLLKMKMPANHSFREHRMHNCSFRMIFSVQ